MLEQDKLGQDRLGLVRTGQVGMDRTGPVRTGQDKHYKGSYGLLNLSRDCTFTSGFSHSLWAEVRPCSLFIHTHSLTLYLKHSLKHILNARSPYFLPSHPLLTTNGLPSGAVV